MDLKKKRNSILKSSSKPPKDDDNLTEAAPTPCLKRRISFKGKSSVREFNREEEAKLWNTSYEISDIQSSNSQSVSSNGVRSFQATRVNTHINATGSESILRNEKMELANKENLQTKFYLPNSTKVKRESLQSTYEYINKSMQSSSIFVQNSSLGISLLEQEKRRTSAPKRSSVTFVMTDGEAQMVASNRLSNSYSQITKINSNPDFTDFEHDRNITMLKNRNLLQTKNNFADMEISAIEQGEKDNIRTNIFKNTINVDEIMDLEATSAYNHTKKDITDANHLGVTMEMSIEDTPSANKKSTIDKIGANVDFEEDMYNIPLLNNQDNSSHSSMTFSSILDNSTMHGFSKFRKLNDEIECGKIKIFPVASVNPTTTTEVLIENSTKLNKTENCKDVEMSFDKDSLSDKLHSDAPHILQTNSKSCKDSSIHFNEDIIVAKNDNTLLSDVVKNDQLMTNIKEKDESNNLQLSNETICIEHDVIVTPTTNKEFNMEFDSFQSKETCKEQTKAKYRRTVYLNDEIQIDTECTPIPSKSNKLCNDTEQEIRTTQNLENTNTPLHIDMDIENDNVETNMETIQNDKTIEPLKIVKSLFNFNVEKSQNDINEKSLNALRDEPKTPIDINKRTIEFKKQTPKIFFGTPHRSLIEFELMEQEVEHDLQKGEDVDVASNCTANNMQIKSKAKRVTTYKPIQIDFDESGISPIDNLCNNSVSKKRSTMHLTPSFSEAKKRQTVYDVFNLETTNDSKHETLKTDSTNKRKTNLFALNMNLDIEVEEMSKNESIKTAICQNVAEERSIGHTSPCQTGDERSVVSIDITGQSDLLQLNEHVPDMKERENALISSPAKLNHLSFCDEIQMPRAITLPNHHNTNVVDRDHICADKNHLDKSKLQSFDSVFEGNPITISDVSTHFLAQKRSFLPKPIHRNTGNSDADQSCEKINSQVNLDDLSPVSSVDHTATEIAKFTKKYIDLAGCTVFDEKEFETSEIEKTRLSLIETLLDDDNEVDKEKIDVMAVNMNDLKNDIEHLRRKTISPDKDSISKSCNANLNRSVNVCRKCKRCQETILNESTASYSDSIVLPKADLFKSTAMDKLKLSRQGPRLHDVIEHFENKRQLDMEPNFERLGKSLICDEVDETVTIILNDLKKSLKIAKTIQTNMESVNYEKTPFVERLEKNLRDRLPNWIFNYQQEAIGILTFTHNKIPLFDIQVDYEEKDALGQSMNILKVTSKEGLDKKFWKPIDYLIDFQMKLELPINIYSTCINRNEDDLIDCLAEINNVTMEVHTLSKYFWRIICSEQASLIRDERGVFIKKCVRKIVSPDNKYSRVEKKEFLIEVINMRKVNFKDIIKPPLYQFEEQIQELPNGLDFLHAFLSNPMKYLKSF